MSTISETETLADAAGAAPRTGPEPLTASAVLLTLLTVVLWAGTPVAIRYSTDLVPPIAVSGLRFALAAVFLLGWSWWHGTSLRLSRGEVLPPLIGGGLLALQIGLFTLGVHRSNASHGSIFINTFIFWIVAIDHWLPGGDRLTLRKFAGLLLAAGGVVLILMTTGTVADAGLLEAASLDGDLLLLTSALILAVKLSYTRHAVRTVHPDRFIFWHSVSGVVLFAVWSAVAEEFDSARLLRLDDPLVRSAWWGIAYQGLAVAGLCFAIQARLFRKHSASRIAVFSFATPLFGILFAVLLRGDPVSGWLFVSGAAVAAGILLINLSDRARPSAAA